MNQYKLLTFDVWDTVLRRRSHADEVKIHTVNYLKQNYPELMLNDNNEINLFRKRQEAEYEIGQANLKNGYDDEYDIKDVFKLWLQNIISVKIDDEKLELIVTELYDVELQHEINITYVDPNIMNVLNEYNYSQRFFLSDFYTDSHFIKEILQAKGIQNETGKTSLELGYNKRSSRLFKKIHELYKVTPEEHFHLGDNEFSDYKQPISLGMPALHYYNKEEELLRKSHNLRFEKRLIDPTSVLSDLNKNIISSCSHNQSSNTYYSEGTKFGAIFIAFILHVIESAKQNKVDTVYYLTREGVFFKKIHDLLIDILPNGNSLPKAELLEVSRLATFSSSLREVSINEFMRVWNQYSIQSMKALFKTLNVDIQNFEDLFQRYHIDIDELIVYPWQNEAVICLFQDQEFISRLSENIKSKKQRLQKYLKEHQIIDHEDTQVFIVDIGWRGTIQDNLAYLLNHSKIIGYYFGLYPFINAQLQNTSKYSFFSQEEMSLIRHVAPLEMMCNAAMGSVTGYEINDSRINVCYEESKRELEVHEKYISHFQRGALKAIEEWIPLLYNQAWTNKELKEFAKELSKELLTQPSLCLANAFFNLAHNETFGVGQFVEKRRKFPLKYAIKALVSFEGKKQFVEYLEESSWPQGLLTYFHLKPLVSIYNNKVYFKGK